jgi:hypothetical protein
MIIKSMEELEREQTKQREELMKHLAIVQQLPTNGMRVYWESTVEMRSIELLPWIIHSPFRGAEHVTYKIPCSYDKDGEENYHYRKNMARAYITALVDAYKPVMIDTLAIKGQYASYVPETFDYKASRDYKDAVIVAKGEYVLIASRYIGEHSYAQLELEFYVQLPNIGPTKIKLDMSDYNPPYQLMPIPVGIRTYGENGPVSSVDRWDVPNDGAARTIHRWLRTDGNSRSKRIEWLFQHDKALRETLGLEEV